MSSSFGCHGQTHRQDVEATGDLNSVAESAVGPSDAALKILVVDDSIDGAEMLAAALSAKGYKTQVAFDGPAALRMAAEFRPAIVFLDIGLPVMDGYELAARLRELPELNGVRLFALTGYGQESDRQRTRDAGFDHHFTKPSISTPSMLSWRTRPAAANTSVPSAVRALVRMMRERLLQRRIAVATRTRPQCRWASTIRPVMTVPLTSVS